MQLPLEDLKILDLSRVYAAPAGSMILGVMCSVTGYGQTGPYRNEPGFDPVIQAISGLMDVTGETEGEPTRVGIPIVDSS